MAVLLYAMVASSALPRPETRASSSLWKLGDILPYIVVKRIFIGKAPRVVSQLLCLKDRAFYSCIVCNHQDTISCFLDFRCRQRPLGTPFRRARHTPTFKDQHRIDLDPYDDSLEARCCTFFIITRNPWSWYHIVKLPLVQQGITSHTNALMKGIGQGV